MVRRKRRSKKLYFIYKLAELQLPCVTFTTEKGFISSNPVVTVWSIALLLHVSSM